MRTPARIMTTLGLALLMLTLTTAVRATAGERPPADRPPAADRAAPFDVTPVFTRILTVTVGSSIDPFTSTYASFWETESISQVYSFYEIPLPTDTVDLDVRLTQGTYDLITGSDAITLVIHGEQPWFYFAYRTGQRVERRAHQLLVQLTASNNHPYRFLGTLIFTDPHQYAGTLGIRPTQIESDRVRWDLIPPLVEIEPGKWRYRMIADNWLADPRLDWPDLAIEAAALGIDRSPLVPEAVVTVALKNSGAMTTSIPAYLNLYDRIAPAPEPTGPIDLAGGWCGEDIFPFCPTYTTFTNPITLGPGQAVTLTASLPLTNAGRHQFHLQLDAFGGPVGLNAETDETNNLIGLGEAYIGRLYLPLVRR